MEKYFKSKMILPVMFLTIILLISWQNITLNDSKSNITLTQDEQLIFNKVIISENFHKLAKLKWEIGQNFKREFYHLKAKVGSAQVKKISNLLRDKSIPQNIKIDSLKNLGFVYSETFQKLSKESSKVYMQLINELPELNSIPSNSVSKILQKAYMNYFNEKSNSNSYE